MSPIDGQILFGLIVAFMLAWLFSHFVANRYSVKVLEYMRSGFAPDETNSAPTVPTESSLRPPSYVVSDLATQNQRAVWRLYASFIAISLALSGIIAYANHVAYIKDGFSWRVFLTLTVVYGWMGVPAIGLLERWTRLKIVFYSFLYMVLAFVLVTLNSTENQDTAGLSIFLMGLQIPVFVFITLMTGSKIRAIAPYQLIVFILLVVASLSGLSFLDYLIKLGDQSWFAEIMQAFNLSASFILVIFSVTPWLIGYFPIKWSTAKLTAAYSNKSFSEPLYLLSSLWLVMLLFQAMMLSHSLGGSAYLLCLAWLIFPVAVNMMSVSLRPQHRPPTLLLLRVFREDKGIESLSDRVIERWRYTGNTVMIAGKDLALRNLEPDQLFDFLGGQLQNRFISDEKKLQEAVQDLDWCPDPDGRYRINEFFCFDSTWQQALNTLVGKADFVLMDLRSFNHQRIGCIFELSVLEKQSHLCKLIILFDKRTDKILAGTLLNASMTKTIWIDCELPKQQLYRKTLSALLRP